MGDYNDNPDLRHAYRAGYSAGRRVVADMGERMGHLARWLPPAAEAMKRVVRSCDVPLGSAEAQAVAEGIDDGLYGRWSRY